MLELKGITKDYPAGDGKVAALKGIDLQFRKSEFVAILGPSGCGKTTMLNLIGGLDQYTSGDLMINGRSTKDFKDRDWDAYRNHSVGFVFQSYNLIPHQSVLQNVELALSLSGVSKSERRQRAKKALEEVGLSTQLNKKPAEMSGGQMQRVAIARAIVNNPDIILADEPTGALDSETSVQVMDILKEIAKDRLVVMVTHNPDLADRYATRTIRMLDGVVISDSAPLSEDEQKAERQYEAKLNETAKKEKKPSMSFFTSFGLSLKNLFTKKGRTALTSFAGSIGIIGIALIYAVSQGMTTYIDTVQEDTLSSYPLTLESQHVDLGTLMTSFISAAESKEEHESDAVYQKPVVYDMVNALSSIETRENDLSTFKDYLERERAKEDSESGLHASVTGVQYTYRLNLPIYTQNVDGKIILSDMQLLMRDMLTHYFGQNMPMLESGNASSMMSMMGGGTGVTLWQELLSGDNGKPVNDLLEKQYDLIYGTWPTESDEIVLVLDENNELDDMTLYALGLESEEDIRAIVDAAFNHKELNYQTKTWTYEEICNMEFCAVLPANCYVFDEVAGVYTDLRDSETGLRYLYDNGLRLRVTGIIRPNEDAVAPMLTGSIGYLHTLTEYVIEQSANTPAVLAQKETPDTDIFTGLPFREVVGEMTESQKEEEFRAYATSLSMAEKADLYVQMKGIPSDAEVQTIVEQQIGSMTRDEMESQMIFAMTQQTGMGEDEIRSYTESMSDSDMKDLFAQMAEERIRAMAAEQARAQMAAIPAEQLVMAFEMEFPTLTAEQCAVYHDELMAFSDSDYDSNLLLLGNLDLDSPASINLYAASFEEKDQIEEAIAAYNETVDDLSKIEYTDYVGLMMSSVTTIINAITYVLIAFVAVSLIVSSIMIGVITLISVQERTKEIGILRAIGASKRNVSSMFNAETVIIGFTSGTLGVLITYLLCIPINAILHYLTGIQNLSAYLPVPVAVVLVVISVVLTLISGIIPSRSAAKKDPVVALRTE